jgi:hypothetical protein
MGSIENDIPLPEPHALNGRRLVTDEERIENHRAYGREYQAEKRKNPEYQAAQSADMMQKYYADLEGSRLKVRENARKRRIRDPQKVNAYARATRERHGKDWVRSINLKCAYGITLQEWNALFEQQGKCCAICKCGDVTRWHTDHNHSTNKVRGILCSNCNSGIGLFRENATALFSAIEYLKR